MEKGEDLQVDPRGVGADLFVHRCDLGGVQRCREHADLRTGVREGGWGAHCEGLGHRGTGGSGPRAVHLYLFTRDRVNRHKRLRDFTCSIFRGALKKKTFPDIVTSRLQHADSVYN